MKKIFYSLLFIASGALAQQTATNYDVASLKIENDYTFAEVNNELWMFGNVDQGNYSEYDVLKSTNGDNWTLVSQNSINLWSQIAHFKGKFYSIGGNDGFMTNEIRTSTDGITWTTQATPPFSARRRHSVLVHNNKLFVIAGAGFNDVWFTENGSTWTQATNALSSDFPHFWDATVVSFKGKLILFGGHKSDWGFVDNERGIYISEDDGVNWTKHEFPIEGVNLDLIHTHFIKDGKFWLSVKINPYHKNEGKSLKKQEERLFSSIDGITWKKEANPLNPIVANSGIRTAIASFNNEIISFSQSGPTTTKEIFEEAPFIVPAIDGQFIRQSGTNSATIVPFDVKNLDGSDGLFDYEYEILDESIITCSGFSVENGELHITPSGKLGETKVIITITDGFNSYKESFYLFVYPDGNNYIREMDNKLVATGADLGGILMFREELAAYGTNSYTFTSSDESFVSSSDVSNFELSVLEYFRIQNFDSNVEGETKFTIHATDGTSNFTREFWLKVGDDAAPVSNGTLTDYEWDSTSDFDYNLPTSSFSDPEGAALKYSSDNIPCGLFIDEATGKITGHTFESLPFDINIIATDRYGKTTNHNLHVIADTSVTLDIEDNLLSNEVINLYPNPSENLITIQTNSTAKTDVFIYNTIGQLMMKNSFSSAKETIQHQLKTGVYYVQIMNGNKNVTKTLVVK
ncbi:T9SS type A sorting domain-containing protein [Aureivirga marina]|uniref:T9SS type A sorting domain-containing protein n=1 Tax=Aureivirga marina TaxID=1182451 RepID=UPI0018C90285|nr:T9SS type A sorting domain-containing protein [Aureivirga marina]